MDFKDNDAELPENLNQPSEEGEEMTDISTKNSDFPEELINSGTINSEFSFEATQEVLDTLIDEGDISTTSRGRHHRRKRQKWSLSQWCRAAASKKKWLKWLRWCVFSPWYLLKGLWWLIRSFFRGVGWCFRGVLRLIGFQRIDRYILNKYLSTYFFLLVLIITIAIIFDFNENNRQDNQWW